MVTNWMPSVVDLNLSLNTFINDPQVIKILRHSIILRPLPDHAHGEAVQTLEILRIENSSQFGFQQEINGQLLAFWQIYRRGRTSSGWKRKDRFRQYKRRPSESPGTNSYRTNGPNSYLHFTY